MSRAHTREIIERISRKIEGPEWEAELEVLGSRARTHVFELRPPIMERYGLWKNRGPKMTGTFALRRVLALSSSRKSGIVPMFVIEEPEHGELYGFTQLAPANALNQLATDMDVNRRFRDIGRGAVALQTHEKSSMYVGAEKEFAEFRVRRGPQPS